MAGPPTEREEMKYIEQLREEALRDKLWLALGHILAAEALSEGDEVVHIQMAKSAVVRVLRALESPLEGKVP